MCYLLKLYILIILVLINEEFSCWREDDETKPNSVTCFEDTPCAHDFKNERHSIGENEQNYRDRIIFPDEHSDYLKTSTSASEPSPQNIQDCLNSCVTSPTYNPVCGSDGITYNNIERLECRMMCGLDVNILHLSACSETQDTTTTFTLKTELETLKACLFLCPTTSEYNPVCGTDNITYFNYGKLICARICGVDVKLERHSPCPKRPRITTEATTTSSQQPYELSEEFLTCLKFCPTTSEYNPVCGSNGKTYHNIGKLQCVRSCGLDLTVVKQSPCLIEK